VLRWGPQEIAFIGSRTQPAWKLQALLPEEADRLDGVASPAKMYLRQSAQRAARWTATAERNLSLPALRPASRLSLRTGWIGSWVRPVHCINNSISRGSVRANRKSGFRQAAGGGCTELGGGHARPSPSWDHSRNRAPYCGADWFA
jgi:hypothetical protein